jgi:hypothetical protein
MHHVPKTNLVRTSFESSTFKACEGFDKRIDQYMQADFKPPDPEYALQQKRGILRSKYHRKQQRKKFLKTHSCEPQFLANS